MELARKFMNFFEYLGECRSLDEVISLYQHQTVAVQWLLGLGAFGVLVLVYIFVVAIFIDKHI